MLGVDVDGMPLRVGHLSREPEIGHQTPSHLAAT